MSDTLTTRLAGLKKDQLAAVAKEVGASGVSARTSAKALRAAIEKRVVEMGRFAGKNNLAAQARPWGGEAIDHGKVRAATAKGLGDITAKINAAIDRVAAPARAPVADKAGRKAKAGQSARAKADIAHLDARIENARASLSIGKPAPGTAKPPTVAALRADAEAAGVKGAGRMTKPQLLDLKNAGKFGLALAAAPVVAAAIAYDASKSQALAAGKDGGAATVDAAKAAAAAGAGSAAVVGTVVGGVKAAVKLAPAAGKVLARALPIVAVAGAVYEAGAGAVKGYQEDGLAGAAKGAAEGIANFATFGAYDHFKNRGAPSTEGKAYLNDAAAEKAASAAPTSVPTGAPAARPAAQQPQGDGQTEGYSRVDSRTGMTVQVQGYRTPKK